MKIKVLFFGFVMSSMTCLADAHQPTIWLRLFTRSLSRPVALAWQVIFFCGKHRGAWSLTTFV